MARTVLDENIRNERIVEVGEYVKKTKSSTRKTAEYFTNTQFQISNATVSDYITRFGKLKSAQVAKIKEQVADSLKKESKDKDVIARVLKAAELYTSGYDINLIAEILSSDIYTVYRDIHKRLEFVDKKLYKGVIALETPVKKKRKNGK